MLFFRLFAVAITIVFTNLPQLLVCYLPSSTTSTTTSFPLYHTSTVILSIHRHDYVSSLFHHHHDQKTPEILLGRR